jgi:hypothetical protein
VWIRWKKEGRNGKEIMEMARCGGIRLMLANELNRFQKGGANGVSNDDALGGT